MTDYDYSIHYARFHDDSAADAERNASWIGQLLRPLMPTDQNAEVLDIGCGYGFALLALQKQGYTNLSGLEVSPQQAARARTKGFAVDVTADTLAFLRTRPDTYDVLLLMDVLEHVPVSSQIDLLRACFGALRPTGRLILTVPNASAVLAMRWRCIDFTHYSSFSEHSLYFVLKNAGFSSIEIDSSKGLGPMPKRLWSRAEWTRLRRWLVRWCWLQVYLAELPWEKIDDISFELNLKAVAFK